MLIAISIYYCTCSVTTTSNSYKIIIKAFDKRFQGFRNKHSAQDRLHFPAPYTRSCILLQSGTKKLFMNRSSSQKLMLHFCCYWFIILLACSQDHFGIAHA